MPETTGVADGVPSSSYQNRRFYLRSSRFAGSGINRLFYITENLPQSLRLLHQRNTTWVSGVGGGPAMVSAQGVVQVELKSIRGCEKGRLRVDTLVHVLPKISLELPMQQVHFDQNGIT